MKNSIREIYEKVKKNEIDIYSLDNETLNIVNKMLKEEVKIKEKYLKKISESGDKK